MVAVQGVTGGLVHLRTDAGRRRRERAAVTVAAGLVGRGLALVGRVDLRLHSISMRPCSVVSDVVASGGFVPEARI